ncbi:MAG: hypothetical protein COU07_03290 [Candidatus Harrisonbacteria bacterium CG10_big_fil_rev_8_21_14_0_10_40_38]|uniref:Glycosyltransferase RgtA/B/C/D-like domain-containing protein n=1 Tax=Candidatus Harrisonbacteria bacterium CG10_big_fil_rev_8_21_14_0_10_40_38 TaxID=1974583 RepID=A0A2H0USX4_9BACT|nr:MAG: hypothetical protein COU07_03290 [Candidatus Harrisonbacteria bacterium CG10_big_fil_rev_8_21_14_0_10_40_38]
MLKKISNWIEKNEKLILSFIISGSILSSIIYSFSFRIEPTVDAKAYDNIAWDIAQGSGYDENSAIGRPGPGYEFFLGFIFRIFGHSYEAVWIIHALLLGASAYFVYKSIKSIDPNNFSLPALVGAFLIGFSPDLITVSSMLLTETLVVFLISGFLYFLIKSITKDKAHLLSISGIFLSAAMLTRSNLSLLVIPVCIFLIYKKNYKKFFLFAGIIIICLTPWTIRNYFIYHEVRPFNAAFGLIYVGNHKGATGELIVDYPLPEGYGDLSSLDQIDFDEILKKEGIKYIKNNPLDFLRLSLIRLSIYISPARPFAFWPHLKGLVRWATTGLSSVYAGVMFVVGFFGIWVSIKTKEKKFKEYAVLLSSLAVVMPVGIVWLIVETRYRFPLYPILGLFVGLGISWLIKKWPTNIKNYKSVLIIILLIIGANSAFDIIRNLGRIADKF